MRSLTVAALLLFLSCSSGDMPVSRHEPDRASPEIGVATMSGGETVKIRGYTGDPEVNRQMKLIDLEIIDCYRQNVHNIGIKSFSLNFSFYIDRTGRPTDIYYRVQDRILNDLGECISNDIRTLSFRPGSPREISSYRLNFIPLKERQEEKSPRTEMIKSLSDMDKFRECYEEELRKSPGIGGKFTLRFMVSEYGDAENIEIIFNTFNAPDVPLCVVKKLAETRFPPGETDDIVEVNFTFTSSAPMKRRRTMDIDL